MDLQAVRKSFRKMLWKNLREKLSRTANLFAVTLLAGFSMDICSICCNPSDPLQKPARCLRTQFTLGCEKWLSAKIIRVTRIKQDHVVIMATILMFGGYKTNRTQVESGYEPHLEPPVVGRYLTHAACRILSVLFGYI
jgi:hypothetical protein